MSFPWTCEKQLSDLGSMVWEDLFFFFFTYGHWISLCYYCWLHLRLYHFC